MQKLRNSVTGIFIDNLLSIHLKNQVLKQKFLAWFLSLKSQDLREILYLNTPYFISLHNSCSKKEPRCRSPYADYDTACKTTKSLFVSRQDKRLGFSKASGWQQICYRVVACG